MSLTTKLTIVSTASLAAVRGFVTPQANAELSYSASLTSGTGTGQANGVHSERYTIAASGTQVINLSTVTDDLGQSVAFTAIKLIVVRGADANAADVTFKPNSSGGFVAPFNATADTLKLAPGGCIVLANPAAAGWTVTATTADKLLLTNTSGAAAATVDVMIVGQGAVT